MARRLHRTDERQVAPDALLGRRLQAPVSIGVRVSEAKRTGAPIYRLSGPDSVFGHLSVSLVLRADDRRVPAPRLVLSEPLWTVRGDGADWRRPLLSTSVVTIATKMACPSWSIPSGPLYEGGTCPAANRGTSGSGGLRVPGKTFICDQCYALEGNYRFLDVTFAQAVRAAFVVTSLTEDTSGFALGTTFADIIEDVARNVKRLRYDRSKIEIGVVRGGRLTLPDGSPCETTRLPRDVTGVDDTAELYRDVPDGEVAGFFRIHDSGDFGLGPPAMWDAYLRAWIVACRALPHVAFWAPTRMWTFRSILGRLKSIEVPKNLVVRASGLHVGDQAPVIEGLPAGSAVVFPTQGHPGAYGCPVYQISEGPKTCMTAGCRACWMARDLPVAYHWH